MNETCDQPSEQPRDDLPDRSPSLRLSQSAHEALAEELTVEVLVEADDLDLVTEILKSEGVTLAGDIQMLADVFPGPMIRARLNWSQIQQLLKTPGVRSMEEDVEIVQETRAEADDAI